MAAGAAYTPAERARLDQLRDNAFLGTPEKVGERLRNLADRLGVGELAVLTWTHGLPARKRSYELLAAEFGIRGEET